jgi:hypothetical protein
MKKKNKEHKSDKKGEWPVRVNASVPTRTADSGANPSQ